MSTPSRDLYAILGVTADASGNDLDHAFRNLVRQHHPDTRTPAPSEQSDQQSGQWPDERFHEVVDAYAALRDPVRRAAYDSSRSAEPDHQSLPVQSQDTIPARNVQPAEPAIRVGPVRWQPPSPDWGRRTPRHRPR